MILDQSRDQESYKNDSLREMRVFSHAIQSSLTSKIKKKHFVIRISIAENKSLSLIDNESEVELINESFAHSKELKLINLQKKDRIKLMLDDEEIAQILNKAIKVRVRTKNHQERLFCYVAKLNTYVLILEDD
jgi:DNA-binding TFAR19-related protein (PDSD5 family)